MARPVVRAVFALLVVATIAAFFATQQLKSEFPLVIRFSAKPKQFSPNGDRYRDSTQVGFDLSRAGDGDVLDHGRRGQRGAAPGGRPPAGRRREAPLPLGRARRRRGGRARRRLPDAGGAPRRGPRDRLLQAHPRRPRAAAGEPGVGDAQRDRAARARAVARGDDLAIAGRRTRRPSSACSAPTTPPSRTWCAASGARAAPGSGTARSRPARSAPVPAPDGDYAFTVSVRDKAGNLAVAPASVPRPALAPAGNGGVGAQLHPAGPARTWCRRARSRRSRSARSTATSTSSSRASATRSRSGAASASADASGWASRRMPRPASTSPACAPAATARSGRSPWPGCRSPSEPRSARARWWCCPRSRGRG